jgi:hypothetical protein
MISLFSIKAKNRHRRGSTTSTSPSSASDSPYLMIFCLFVSTHFPTSSTTAPRLPQPYQSLLLSPGCQLLWGGMEGAGSWEESPAKLRKLLISIPAIVSIKNWRDLDSAANCWDVRREKDLTICPTSCHNYYKRFYSSAFRRLYKLAEKYLPHKVRTSLCSALPFAQLKLRCCSICSLAMEIGIY